MRLAELDFFGPQTLEATGPAEARSGSRDEVRLLVTTPSGHHHSRFKNLANFLEPNDLLVVNRSATLPASLLAEGRMGPFVLNLSTRYSSQVWLAEPRWSYAKAGPLPFRAGEQCTAAGLVATFLNPYPNLPRLWFVRFKGDVAAAMKHYGQPIRYGYLDKAYPLDSYQTLFADIPGSAEMPSAARPFSERVLECLKVKGVNLAKIVLHTGVSSLEFEAETIDDETLFPEPFELPAEAANLVNETRDQGGRVIAVGTTVVRALESSWDERRVRAAKGFTRHYVRPGRAVNVVDGLISGFHEPKASHLAMLYALAGKELIQEAYAEAIRTGYLWHEFGDSHLILPRA